MGSVWIELNFLHPPPPGKFGTARVTAWLKLGGVEFEFEFCLAVRTRCIDNVFCARMWGVCGLLSGERTKLLSEY